MKKGQSLAFPEKTGRKIAQIVESLWSMASALADPDDEDEDEIPFNELIWLQTDANLKVRNS